MNKWSVINYDCRIKARISSTFQILISDTLPRVEMVFPPVQLKYTKILEDPHILIEKPNVLFSIKYQITI